MQLKTNLFWVELSMFFNHMLYNCKAAVLLYALFPYPLHASCRVEWTVPGTCEAFSAALVRQMRAWEVTVKHVSYLSSYQMK